MAGSRKRRPTIAQVAKWIQKGFGQGEGEQYKPWFFVRDVPSRGTSSMVKSPITGREHHYVSRIEWYVHLLCEYSPRVIDIREQYALLPWSDTQWIADRLGINHPVIPYTKTPSVLTTDLLVSVREADGIRVVAVSVKPDAELDARSLEKLLIERVYWERLGITWFLATPSSLPMTRAENLGFFEGALRSGDVATSGIEPKLLAREFERLWTPEAAYIEVLQRACQAIDLSDESLGHRILGAAVWNRQSRIDIDSCPMNHDAPCALRLDL